MTDEQLTEVLLDLWENATDSANNDRFSLKQEAAITRAKERLAALAGAGEKGGG